MGPKKKGGGDGAKGGKGKASKLAKMNEQERTRYLERKMAEEEETKRRKEEMINVFLKMKLNKEERNSGLNTSKLIDRWRGIRREAKSKELIQDVTVLQETFERALMRKNRHIELLLQDLEESEEQYNMCVRCVQLPLFSLLCCLTTITFKYSNSTTALLIVLHILSSFKKLQRPLYTEFFPSYIQWRCFC